MPGKKHPQEGDYDNERSTRVGGKGKLRNGEIRCSACRQGGHRRDVEYRLVAFCAVSVMIPKWYMGRTDRLLS